MKINQVEQTIGITKKNIRFYEQEGLLKPVRIANGYRDYSPEDLERLRLIKLLRKLDIPIEEIRRLQEGSQTLKDCLERHLISLRRRHSNLEAMERFCIRLLDEDRTLDNLDAEALLREMEQQESRGVMFKNIQKDDKRKLLKSAVLSAVVVLSILLLSLGFLVWLIFQNLAMLAPLFLILFLTHLILIVGTLLALWERIKEIEGGEMNEASKY